MYLSLETETEQTLDFKAKKIGILKKILAKRIAIQQNGEKSEKSRQKDVKRQPPAENKQP